MIISNVSCSFYTTLSNAESFLDKMDPNGYIKKSAKFFGPAAYFTKVAYNTYKETFENDDEKCFYANKKGRDRYAIV